MAAEVGAFLSGKEPTATGDTNRRARKRETDRRAQRDHRQRQKAYVRQLEEVVRDLNAQHSRDDRILALQTEKIRLQERCNLLSAKLERIRVTARVDDVSLPEVPKSGASSPVNNLSDELNHGHRGVSEAFDLMENAEPLTQEEVSPAAFPDEGAKQLDSAVGCFHCLNPVSSWHSLHGLTPTHRNTKPSQLEKRGTLPEIIGCLQCTAWEAPRSRTLFPT